MKLLNLRYTFFAVLAILLSFTTSARHIKGGWMYYEFVSSNNGINTYRVVVKVYRDCATPNPGQNDASITISAFNNATNALANNFTAPLTNQYDLSKTSFSECISPRPSVCYVVLEYATTVSLPENGLGYTLSFQRCCRISGIANLQPPSDTYGNTYTITIPGNGLIANAPANNSPVFQMNDTVVVCYNSNIVFDYGARDIDGDSLSYFLTGAINGGSQGAPAPIPATAPPYFSLPYSSGYSPSNPFGTSLSINSNTGLITGRSPNITGEYVIAVGVNEFRKGELISTTRKELHVNVASCSIVAAELPLGFTSCDGFTVKFENLSSSPAILEYYWDFGVTTTNNDTSTAATPSFTYPDTGIYHAKLIVNRNSGCVDSATEEIRVFPGFSPGFITDGSCYLNNFIFTDTTKAKYGKVNSWRWDFGNTTATNDTSRLQNPVYKFPGMGTYNVMLDVGSDKGCRDTVTVPVVANDKPVLQLPFKDTLICSIDTLQLRAIGTGSFVWDPSPTLINSTSPTPLVFPKDTTVYKVTLTDNGCIATDSVKVNVLDFITIDAGADTTICLTDGVAMRPVTHALSFNWQPSAIFANNTLRNAIATPLLATTKVYVTANLGKCQANDSLQIRTVPYPTANAGNDTIICFNTAATLHGSGNGSRFAWSPAASLTNPNNLVTAARPAGTTTYTLSVSDVLGCPKPVTDDVIVTVRPQVIVFAGNDTTAVFGQPLVLNASSNATIFNWTPTTAMNNAQLLKPTLTFTSANFPAGNDQITYVVNASTPEGCTATDQIVVKVFRTGPSIFVPNGFTPNTDGLNDLIRPILAGMQRLDFFRIYNRYGQLVYETKQSGAGWDGRVKGIMQGSSAFVYHCQAVDYAGNVITQKGSFVLIQ